MLTGRLERLAGQHGLDHRRGQLARLPGLEVLGTRQPGVDVRHVFRLVLLTPGDRAERDVVGRTPPRLGVRAKETNSAMCRSPAAGKRAPAVEQGELEHVALGEVELGELLGLGPSRMRGQRLQAADLFDAARGACRTRPRRRPRAPSARGSGSRPSTDAETASTGCPKAMARSMQKLPTSWQSPTVLILVSRHTERVRVVMGFVMLKSQASGQPSSMPCRCRPGRGCCAGPG